MGLQYAVEDLNDLDESVQSLYEQDGDRYILRVEGIPQPEDTSGLKSKVQQLMDEAKEAKRRAKELESQKQQQEMETAQEKGEFKNLWEQAQAKLAEKDKDTTERHQYRCTRYRLATCEVRRQKGRGISRLRITVCSARRREGSVFSGRDGSRFIRTNGSSGEGISVFG
jgi:DNA repair exonuclease SbcCD ATPase subunit